MRKNGKARLMALLTAAAMLLPLCAPAAAAEGTGTSAVTGSVTAALRIDYAQRLDELERRDVRMELKQGRRSLGWISLWKEGETHLDGYPVQVTAKNMDGGALGGGRWPGYLEVVVDGLPRGEYTLSFAGRGYHSYSQKVALDTHSQHVVVGTGDATFTLGDVTGDGVVDQKDRTALSAVLGSNRAEDVLVYDLSGDGCIDIVDLAYVNRLMSAQGGAVLRDTTLLAPPADLAASQSEMASRGTVAQGSLAGVLTGGEGVTLRSTAGDDIVLPIPLRESVSMEQVRIVTPDGGGEILAGEVLVEDETGGVTTVAFDHTLPQGVHAVGELPEGKVITVALGRRVPVKKITITVTKTEGGYAAVESIQFLKDIVPETPVAPNSMVKGLTAEAGSEYVNLKWIDLPNVSGYKVLYWPQDSAKEVKELHTDVAQTRVNGLKNLETYVFTVTATDGSWQGKPSDPVTATPRPASVPDKTDMVRVTALDGALGVSWKAGKSATSYEVYYRTAPDGQWTRSGEAVTRTNLTVGGLTNDVTYQLYVVALNDVGRGPRSDISEGIPKAVKYERPAGIPTEGILDSSLIRDIRLADAGNYAGSFQPRYLIDNDYHTAWTARNWWRNEHIEVTFTRPVDLSAAIWVPRLDGSYPTYLRAYSVRAWYEGEDLTGPGHLLAPDPQEGGLDNGGTGRDVDTWPALRGNAAVNNFAVLPFGPEKQITKLSLAVEQRDYLTVSLSELMFLEYDPEHSLPGEIDALFADDLRTTLAPGVTRERIDALRERLNGDERNYYLELNTMADELVLAQELLETGSTAGLVKVGVESRSGAGDGAKYSQGGSVLQPLGVTAGAKREITVYAQGIPVGETLTLYASQFNAEASQWLQAVGTLVNGRNVLTVPKIGSRVGNSGGSLYLTYSGQGGENIKLHVRRGVVIPTLELSGWYAMDEGARKGAIGAYVDDLEGYLASITIGSPTTDYRNVTEIATPVVLLSLPAQAVKNALGAGSRAEKVETIYNSVLAWEDIMAICKQTQGIDRVYAENDMETRQNIRCMTMFAGAFMYAAGNHIGIGYGSCGGMVTGQPIALLPEGAGANKLFGWGIAHEIGHNMDKLGKAEITNNIYSIMVQTWDGKQATLASRLEKSGKYAGIFTKVAQGYPGASNDVFVQLGMYWQLHLAYDEADPLAFYNAFFKAWKAGTYTAGAKSYDDRVALTAAGVARRDLTEFFTRWGMALSEETKKTLAGYDKESRAIWYLSDQSRRERLAGTIAATGAITAQAQKTGDKEVLISIDATAVQGKLQGFEILRNGKSIAFVQAGEEKTATYTDLVGTANHRTFRYEVVAYDILGNQVGAAADGGEVRIAYDKTVAPEAYELTVKDGIATFAMKGETPVSGLKLRNFRDGGESYTVTVTDGQDKKTVALTGRLTGVENLAVDDKSSFVNYFKMPGAAQTDTRIWTYDAKTVTVTGIPAGTTAEDIQLISYPGDDVAFLEGGTMGTLSADYHYTALNEAGVEVTETIPAGTLVILGTYRGDPVYNTIAVRGRFTDTAIQADGTVTESEAVEREVAGYAFLFAEIPAVGQVSDISDGLFLFVPDIQGEAQLQGESSHCEAVNLLPSQIRVELYRTDDPNDITTKRLTAQTLWIHSPGGTQEELPTVVLEGGQGQ